MEKHNAGKQLKRLRIIKGLTQIALGNDIGVGTKFIWRIEKGYFPIPSNISKVARGYGITVKKLVDLLYQEED